MIHQVNLSSLRLNYSRRLGRKQRPMVGQSLFCNESKVGLVMLLLLLSGIFLRRVVEARIIVFQSNSLRAALIKLGREGFSVRSFREHL